MNSKYHIAGFNLQSSRWPDARRTAAGTWLASARAIKPLRIPVPIAPSHPVLVGDKNMLRRLRASEMAAWEAVGPSTGIAAEPSHAEQPPLSSPATRHTVTKRRALWLLLVLSLGALVVFLSGSNQDSTLPRWSQMFESLRRFLA